MNPLEFWWTEDQQVTVVNPTAETHKFKIYGKDYELAAGKSARMPGFIAWQYAYSLAQQMAVAEGVFNRWNEEEFRKTYYEKVVSGVEPVMQAVAIEEQPLVETLDNQEDTSDTDIVQTDKEEGEPVAEPELSKVTPMKPKATSVRPASRA